MARIVLIAALIIGLTLAVIFVAKKSSVRFNPAPEKQVQVSPSPLTPESEIENELSATDKILNEANSKDFDDSTISEEELGI